MRSSKPIMLVEDDEVDCMTVQRVLKDVHITNRLDIARDGEEAIALLQTAGHERPAIILLDLNMPKMNGIEFLRMAKQDAALKRIPVIVLTTSREEEDKLRSYDLGAAGYMLKPVDYRRFVEMVRTIDLYWTLSELPE